MFFYFLDIKLTLNKFSSFRLNEQLVIYSFTDRILLIKHLNTTNINYQTEIRYVFVENCENI